jgi:lipopolysaccharide export system protein LptA
MKIWPRRRESRDGGSGRDDIPTSAAPIEIDIHQASLNDESVLQLATADSRNTQGIIWAQAATVIIQKSDPDQGSEWLVQRGGNP